MKSMVWMAMVVVAGGAVWAQETPGAGVTPVGRPPVLAQAPASISPTTNAVSGKTDLAKVQALYSELGSLNKELQPHEEVLQASDPDLKALVEKRDAARQKAIDIEIQRRALVDQKLAADPKLAPLVSKRHELQQTLKAMRPAMSPGGSSPMGYGARHRPSLGGAEPAGKDAGIKIVPAPAPADQPVSPAK